jgi:hypothetical protein
MPRTKSSISSGAPDACALVTTESPVSGVKIEVGILLVQAVKARRAFLSKSSLPVEDEDKERESLRRDLLRNLHDTADDKASAFLNELKRQAQNKSSWPKSVSSSSKRGKTNSTPADAPVRCVEFLLEILSDASNSFHLRRSALALTRQILVRSSAVRAYFACGRCLLNFARMIKGEENDQVEDNGRDGGSYRGISNLSPKSLFQLEAMELVHDLASQFGEFYTRFRVASRLLGDSSNTSMHFIIRDTANSSSDSEVVGSKVRHSQRDDMRTLRSERDTALKFGPRACQRLERMVGRADEYFRILVPRFGGFNGDSLERRNKHTNAFVSAEIPEISTADDSKLTSITDEVALNNNKDGGIHHNEDDGGSSIDWEEGDMESDNETFNAGADPFFDDINCDESIDDHFLIDHQVAVTRTLEVMERSGALLEGAISIQVMGSKSIEVEPIETQGQAPVEEVVVLRKLQKLVHKFSRQLPRLNQWICALSHADGMEERTVVDPITAQPLVSLRLLSEKNRAMRTKLLQRFMTVRGEIEGALQSSSKLGIGKSGTKMRALKKNDHTAQVNEVTFGAELGLKRRLIYPGFETMVMSSKRKKHNTARFNIIYQKNKNY